VSHPATPSKPMPRWIAPSDHYAWMLSLIHRALAQEPTGTGLLLTPILGDNGSRLPGPTPDARDVIFAEDSRQLLWTDPYHGRSSATCPFPAPGQPFYIGERWYPDQGERPSPSGGDPLPTYAPRYKANLSDELYEGERWRPAKSMTEEDARLRFEVVSRSPVQIRDLNEEDASRAHALRNDQKKPTFYIGTERTFRGMHLYFEAPTHLKALEAMWPVWFRGMWYPTAWIWRVEVRRFDPPRMGLA
jgi:hypothetical protein